METLVNEGMSWQMQDELDNMNILYATYNEQATEEASHEEVKNDMCDDCDNKNSDTKERKFEFSKLMVLLCFLIGIGSIVAYYLMIRLAILTPNCVVIPDSALAVTGMSEIVGSVLSYFLYQGFLKNSRNKYNVDEYGKPWENAPYK